MPAKLIAAGAALLLLAASDPQMDPGVRGVLVRHLHFSQQELEDLGRGRIVGHRVESTTPGEVTVAGAVRIDAPKSAFVAALHDMVNFKSGPDVLEIGLFSNPPKIEDLAALTVDRIDFDPQRCRVGDCGIRLPADVIRRVPMEIDLKSADVRERTEAWFKRMLIEQVKAYASGAPGRFDEYDDMETPVRPLDAFDGLLKAASPAIAALVPDLPGHIARFPIERLADAEDFLYWSKEKFASEPFITVTHVTLVCPSAATCVMITKDVYSSRYFDASLALSIATDVPEDPRAFYLVYANRSRASALRGAFAGLRRSIVERRARGGLEDSLKTIKGRFEAAR